MKLFVWNDPYVVKWGGSTAYAVAETEDEARALVMKAPISQYGLAAKGSAGLSEDVLGAPDRVVELPYAEIYEWSE